MKKLMRQGLLSAVLLSFAMALSAQDSKKSFEGKWVLDVSKSKFEPPPGYKSETVTITENKVAVEGVDGEGKSFSWSYVPKNGVAVPIEGMDNSTVVEKRSDRTVDHSWKLGEQKLQGHGMVAADGKTLTYRQTGKTSDGKSVRNLLTFERQ